LVWARVDPALNGSSTALNSIVCLCSEQRQDKRDIYNGNGDMGEWRERDV